MTGGRGTSEHTCTACGRTFELTRQPDHGADYVCMDCRYDGPPHVFTVEESRVGEHVHGSKPSDVAKTIVEQRKRHGAALQQRLYDARVEDQEQT